MIAVDLDDPWANLDRAENAKSFSFLKKQKKRFGLFTGSCKSTVNVL